MAMFQGRYDDTGRHLFQRLDSFEEARDAWVALREASMGDLPMPSDMKIERSIAFSEACRCTFVTLDV